MLEGRWEAGRGAGDEGPCVYFHAVKQFDGKERNTTEKTKLQLVHKAKGIRSLERSVSTQLLSP